MKDALIAAVQGLPPEAATALLAMIPVMELRGALPAGIAAFQLAPWAAWFWSVVGNLVPVPVIMFLLPPVVMFAEQRVPWFHRFLERYFHALEHKHRGSYERWGALALALFVAVPLPMTGAWSASVLAVLFRIPRKTAFGSIAAGVVAAGFIVLILTLGAIRLF